MFFCAIPLIFFSLVEAKRFLFKLRKHASSPDKCKGYLVFDLESECTAVYTNQERLAKDSSGFRKGVRYCCLSCRVLVKLRAWLTCLSRSRN
jgi:hypothetical protein